MIIFLIIIITAMALNWGRVFTIGWGSVITVCIVGIISNYLGVKYGIVAFIKRGNRLIEQLNEVEKQKHAKSISKEDRSS